MSRSQRKFRNILINPRYQLKYVFWLSASGLALTLLYSAIFYFFTRENYTILVDMSPMDAAAKDQLHRELGQIVVMMGVISLGFLSVVCALGVWMSHRTAGPLFHFKRVFAAIQSGDTSARIRLRPGDDFQDVAGAFNAMMDSMADGVKAKQK